MNAAAAPALTTTTTRPPNLYFDMTGEAFEFQTSAKSGDGVFRFRWTLQGGKKGPPEHVHDDENETFTIVSGTLRIWVGGKPQDLGPGQSVTVAKGERHRFLNPTKEPVVVDCALDGPRQEDALVPLAIKLGGGHKMRIRDVFTMFAHVDEVRASHPPGRIGTAIFFGLGKLIRLFGARPLPRAAGW